MSSAFVFLVCICADSDYFLSTSDSLHPDISSVVINFVWHIEKCVVCLCRFETWHMFLYCG